MAEIDLTKISFDEGLQIVARCFEKHAQQPAAPAAPPAAPAAPPAAADNMLSRLWGGLSPGAQQMLIGGGIGAALGGGTGLISDQFREKERRHPLGRMLSGMLAGGIAGTAAPVLYNAGKDVYQKFVENPNVAEELKRETPKVRGMEAPLVGADSDPWKIKLSPYASTHVGELDGVDVYAPPPRHPLQLAKVPANLRDTNWYLEHLRGLGKTLGEQANPLRWIAEPGTQLADLVIGPNRKFDWGDFLIHAGGLTGGAGGYRLGDELAKKLSKPMAPDSLLTQLMTPSDAKAFGVPSSAFQKAYSQLRNYGQSVGLSDPEILKMLQRGGSGEFAKLRQKWQAELAAANDVVQRARKNFNKIKQNPLVYSAAKQNEAREALQQALRARRATQYAVQARQAVKAPQISTPITPANVAGHAEAVRKAMPVTLGRRALRGGGAALLGIGTDMLGRGIGNYLVPSDFDALLQRHNAALEASGLAPVTAEEYARILNKG